MPLLSRTCAKRVRTAALLTALGVPVPVAAATIPPAYVEAAEAYAAPPAILFAVALAESELLLTSNRAMPWPWTAGGYRDPRSAGDRGGMSGRKGCE